MICINTDRLMLRELENIQSDKMLVIELLKDLSILNVLSQDKEFSEIYNEIYWKETAKANIFNMLIFIKETGEFIGKVCMQNTNTDFPEIGIDILKKYQNNGYGPEAIRAFALWYCEKNGISEIKVRIDKENLHSIHVFEKLGAEYIKMNKYCSEKVSNALKENVSSEIYQEFAQDNIREYILKFPLSISQDCH